MFYFYILKPPLSTAKLCSAVLSRSNPPVLRCIKCQRLGHSNKNCKFNKRCVCCSGNSCDKEYIKEILKCSNCSEEYSSAYKGCRAYHQAIKENEQKYQIKTYAEIAKSTDKKIDKELNDIKTKMKTHISSHQLTQ